MHQIFPEAELVNSYLGERNGVPYFLNISYLKFCVPLNSQLFPDRTNYKLKKKFFLKHRHQIEISQVEDLQL